LPRRERTPILSADEEGPLLPFTGRLALSPLGEPTAPRRDPVAPSVADLDGRNAKKIFIRRHRGRSPAGADPVVSKVKRTRSPLTLGAIGGVDNATCEEYEATQSGGLR